MNLFRSTTHIQCIQVSARLRRLWDAGGKRKAGIVITATFVAIASACGGGNTAPSAPEPPPATPNEVLINVTATGFKPKDSVLAIGGQATFTNIDDRLHSVASNPLTTHADCPAINAVGVLVPGQSKSTAMFTEAKTCGYHDPSSEGSGQILMGTITVR